MTDDLERAVAELPPATRELMARAFLDTASRYVARGETAYAGVYAATAGLLLASDLPRAAGHLGRRGRHQLARTLTTARDRRLGGGDPVDVQVADFFHVLAVLLMEVTDAEDAVVHHAAQQLEGDAA